MPTEKPSHSPSTGAGAEAAEGEHARTGADRTRTDRSGSEPLERDREHKSGYGGEGGEPRKD